MGIISDLSIICSVNSVGFKYSFLLSSVFELGDVHL